MIHIQDGIEYTIENGILKGWIGESPFQKPEWNGTEIVEGWTEEDSKKLIQENLIILSQANKEALIQEKIKAQVLESAQNATDKDALEQKDLYPFWSGDAVSYELGFRVLDFTAKNELALYKVIQAHTSQSNWNPISVPALFTRVQLDEVLDWVQPTGAQDAYNEGDQVIFPSGSGSIWESTVDANVFAPGVVAGQWVKL